MCWLGNFWHSCGTVLTVLAQLLCVVGIADQTLFLLQTYCIVVSKLSVIHGSVRIGPLIFFILH